MPKTKLRTRPPKRVLALGALQLCNSEIQNLDVATRGDEDIGGRHVSVDDSAAVRRV
jgi:hypothetical protein